MPAPVGTRQDGAVSDRIPPFAAYITLLAGMPAVAAAAAPLRRPRKTHCKQGHERAGGNLRIKRDGTYDCRLCQKLFAAASRDRSKRHRDKTA